MDITFEMVAIGVLILLAVVWVGSILIDSQTGDITIR